MKSRCGRHLMCVSGAVAIIAIGVMTAGCASKGTTNPGGSAPATNPGAGATATTTGAPGSGQTSQSSTAAGSAVVLPFTGLDRPVGVAVDLAGAVYVTD